MPAPGCVCRYAMPPGGKSMRSQRTSHSVAGAGVGGALREAAGGKVGAVAADEPLGRRIELDLGGECGVGACLRRELPEKRGRVSSLLSEGRLVPVEVVDDTDARPGCDA